MRTRDRHPALAAAAVSLVALSLVGCASRPFGPRTVGPAQRGYNEALGHALDEQLLLNLVRLRYRDTPVFLEFSSVVAQFSRSASLGASLKLVNGGGDEGGVSAGFGGSESPVLTLVPLKGEDFVRRMLEPIQPESVVALALSGWSVERLLVCCVQEVAGVRNAQTASGPTPLLAPEFEDFQRLAKLLRDLQLAGGIDMAVDDHGALYFDFERLPAGALADERAELVRLLGLSGSGRFRLTLPHTVRQADEVSFVGRSAYGVMQLLAQAIEVPAEDERAGRVTVTRTASGERFDWSRLLGGVFAAHSGPVRPENAAVAISYRGHWFWIADDDLDSKTTFSLLSLLLSLKAGRGAGQTPLLTIGN